MSIAGRDGTDGVDKLAMQWLVYILNLLCEEIAKIIISPKSLYGNNKLELELNLSSLLLAFGFQIV